MANIMLLSIFKMLNLSEFDMGGNSISGFNMDMTRLSAYGYTPLQQFGVRLINFIFNKKYFKMIIEAIYIHQEQRNLARYDSKVVDKCTKYTDETFSKSEYQDENTTEAEVADVTEEWMDSMKCIDNVQFDFQGPNYIHPASGIKSRPSLSSRKQLRAMYPECFTGIGTFKS